MGPTGMETHDHHKTTLVVCQIDFLSFERPKMSNRAHVSGSTPCIPGDRWGADMLVSGGWYDVDDVVAD